MNSALIESVKEGIKKISSKYLSEEDGYLVDTFLANFTASKASSLLAADFGSIMDCARQMMRERIVVDGVYNALIVRGNKMSIHENLKKVLAKLGEERGIYVSCGVFSKTQIQHLRKNELTVPDSPADMPLGLEYGPAKSVFDAAAVVTCVKEKGIMIHRELTSVSNLLNSARREIKDGVLCVVHNYRGTRRYTPDHGPWAGGSDSLEMIKKTAIRQALKYIL